MDKKIISSFSSKKLVTSLSFRDFEHLSELASYLLSIKVEKYLSPISGEDYFINSEPVAFSASDLALLKKLKHLHVLSYDKK